MSVAEWEQMTPRELAWLLDAYGENAEEQARMTRTKIYSLASAVRTMIWAKHPPSYERMFPEDRRKKEMTDEEMFEQVRALNALFGGKEE